MQVVTDAQWAKFEEAMAAAEIRGARPRTEDRRTIEAISGGSTTGRSGVRSQPNWATGIMPTCASAGGLCVAYGTRSWRTWSLKESRNWPLPASTGPSLALIKRHPVRGPARLWAKAGIESCDSLAMSPTKMKRWTGRGVVLAPRSSVSAMQPDAWWITCWHPARRMSWHRP